MTLHPLFRIGGSNPDLAVTVFAYVATVRLSHCVGVVACHVVHSCGVASHVVIVLLVWCVR